MGETARYVAQAGAYALAIASTVLAVNKRWNEATPGFAIEEVLIERGLTHANYVSLMGTLMQRGILREEPAGWFWHRDFQQATRH